MFQALGRLAARRPWPVCAVWLAAAAVVALLAPSWDNRAQDDDIRFLPERCQAVRGYHLLEEAFPQDVFASRVVFAVERPAPGLSDADLALVDAFVADLNRLRADEPALQIHRVYSHRDPFIGKRLLSADRQCCLLQVSLGTPYLALQTRTTVDRCEQCLRERLARAGPDAPTLYVTGPAGVGRDLTAAGADSLESTTLATVLLVVVVLLLVHRAPLLALIPLIAIAGSVFLALNLLALGTRIPGFQLMQISRIFVVVMLYGAGTDYCLFLIARYREELARGHDRDEAVARSVAAVGGALTASAATVICGLGLMGLAEFAKVRCGGPAIAVSLVVALAASLTLAPALLQILGPLAFWPHLGTKTRRQGDKETRRRGDETSKEGRQKGDLLVSLSPCLPLSTFWDRTSRQVVSRPGMVFAAAVVVLLPLALLGFGVQANYRATAELSPDSSSVQGLQAIQRHFTAGEVGPITVLLESGTDWESTAGQRLLRHLSQGFGFLDNVAEVRSLTQPLGSPVTLPSEPTGPNLQGPLFKSVWRNVMQGVAEQIQKAAREFYLARLPGKRPGDPDRYVTRLDVVLHTDPFDARSTRTLEVLELWLHDKLPEETAAVGPVQTACYGTTVGARDLAEVTESDRLRIDVPVLAAVFLILLVLVRQPVLAAYLLATVLLSYLAALGATTLVAHAWSGRPLGEVDWRVPFFLFTILVAVGEDYNILLITRALQERRRHGAIEGTRQALARTGGTITSCGLIMAGTFATLMLGGLNTLVQIGFALGFGVLLDTFVVRPLLVPAFAVWWWGQGGSMDSPAPARPRPRSLRLLRLRRVA
jgi:RND superfamily putative drug exporter